MAQSAIAPLLHIRRASGDYPLARFTEPFNTEFNDVARLEILRRFHSQPNTRGSPSADDVARQKRHELADVGDEERYAKNHFRSRAALAEFPIDFEPHVEVTEVG